MKNLSTCICLFLAVILIQFHTNPLWGQSSFIWTKQAKGDKESINKGNGTAIDEEGNIYVVGEFHGILEIDTFKLNSNGEFDIFLAKYDPDGNALWVRKAGGKSWDVGSKVAIDLDGNIYITGYYSSKNCTFEHIVLNTSANDDPNNKDFFLAKYNTEGSIIWVKSGSGMNSQQGIDLVVDDQNQIFVCGSFTFRIIFDTYTMNGDVSNLFIAKFNSSGELKDALASKGEGNDHVHGIAIDPNRNIYLTGSFQEYISFEDISIGPALRSDGFIAKFTSDMHPEWVKSFGGQFGDSGLGINTDTKGAIFVTGIFINKAYFDSILLRSDTTQGQELEEIFITKYDSQGNAIWAKSASGGNGSEKGTSVVVDKEGNSYITGDFSNDPGIFGGIRIPSYKNSDIFIAQYDADGNIKKVAKAGGVKTETGLSLAVTPEGNIILTGFTTSTPAYFGADKIIANGSEKMFVSKLSTLNWKFLFFDLTGNKDTICFEDFVVRLSISSSSFPITTEIPEFHIEISNSDSDEFPDPPVIIGQGKSLGIYCTLPESIRPGKYKVQARTNGEVSSNEIEILIKCKEAKPDIFIPNVFTPNDDKLNDTFKVDYKGYEDFQMEIFNRWGKKIVILNNNNRTWDGGNFPSGVYYYHITIGKYQWNGWVQLLR